MIFSYLLSLLTWLNTRSQLSRTEKILEDLSEWRNWEREKNKKRKKKEEKKVITTPNPKKNTKSINNFSFSFSSSFFFFSRFPSRFGKGKS